MPKEENQNPSQPPEENDDFSKEISVAEEIRDRALTHYKQLSIDVWNIQQSVIRNYLWLSLTFLAAYFTFILKIIDKGDVISDTCPLIVLSLSVVFAVCALIIGIRSMTGNSVVDPIDNYVEHFNYLTSEGYDQGNHYALLTKEIQSIKDSIDRTNDLISDRGLSMRIMNRLLIVSVATGLLSAVLYFQSTL